MGSWSEADTVKAAAKELEAMYDRYFGHVLKYVCYRVDDLSSADDLTSQIFERAVAGFEKFDPERGHLRPWLFTIARNTVNDHLRRQKRWRWFPLDAVRRRQSPSPQPLEQVTLQEQRRHLALAMEKLTARERDIVSLKFAGGLTNRHIGRLTGLSASNVGVILFRAMRTLRELLSQGESNHA